MRMTTSLVSFALRHFVRRQNSLICLSSYRPQNEFLHCSFRHKINEGQVARIFVQTYDLFQTRTNDSLSPVMTVFQSDNRLFFYFILFFIDFFFFIFFFIYFSFTLKFIGPILLKCRLSRWSPWLLTFFITNSRYTVHTTEREREREREREEREGGRRDIFPFFILFCLVSKSM